jgi:subtilase family serine protease
LEKVQRRKTFAGSKIFVQSCEGNYLSMKKKLYYANRLQLSSNPHIQPLYAYSMNEKQANRWKLSLITDRAYQNLADLWDSQWFHSFKMKI